MTTEAIEVKGKDRTNHQHRWVIIGNPAHIKKVVNTFEEMLNGEIPDEKPEHINQDDETWKFNKKQAQEDKLQLTNITEFVEVDRSLELYTKNPETKVIN